MFRYLAHKFHKLRRSSRFLTRKPPALFDTQPKNATAAVVNALGLKLLLKWREEHPKDNVIISPYAAAMIVCLLREGAARKTRKALNAALPTGTTTCCDLASRFDSGAIDSSGILDVDVHLNNSIYVDKSIDLKKSYRGTVGRQNVVEADLHKGDELADERIDEVTDDNTEGHAVAHAVTLSKKKVSSEETLVMILSSLNFKGRWETDWSTTTVRFHAENGDNILSRAIETHRGSFRIKEVPILDGRLIQIPYMGNQFAMFILLPDRRDGWKDAEQKLADHLPGLFIDGFEPTEAVITMPMWKMEEELDVLEGVFKKAKLKRLSSNSADFSNMSRDPMKLSDTTQKTNIDVDEVGTEVVASSRALISERSYFVTKMSSDDEDVDDAIFISVDHPFLYFIVDITDNAILFQGSVLHIDPVSSNLARPMWHTSQSMDGWLEPTQ